MSTTLADSVLFSAEGPNSYRVLESIGEGGNSSVYLGLGDSGQMDGVPVAIKVFTGREERRDGFFREIGHLRENPHPAVLDIYDLGISKISGSPFYVSRYMPRTLRHQIEECRTDRYTNAILATQLLAAVAHLGRTGPFVHRDIKPENFFINGHAGVLGDFGMIVKEGDNDIEHGTPKSYRTPELVAHKKEGALPTRASDLFQCGLVIAEMFTGVNPLPAVPGDRYADVPMIELEIDENSDMPIVSIVNQMLRVDSAHRGNIEQVLSLFKGIVQIEVDKRREGVVL